MNAHAELLEEQVNDSAAIFSVLGDETRLAVLVKLALAPEPLTVTEVAELVDHVDMSGVSRHLKALREAGVVVKVRQGRSSLHQVDYARLAGSLRGLADIIDLCCPPHAPAS